MRAGMVGDDAGGDSVDFKVGMEVLSTSAMKVANELRRLGIAAQVTEMPASTRTASDAAAAVGCEIGQIVKSLLFKSSASGEPLLVLVSGADRVDEARLAEVAGEKVERADAGFVRSRTGFAIGGVPPLGHIEAISRPSPRYLDERLLGYEVVWAAAGTPNAVFPVNPRELTRATSATVVSVSADT